MDDRCSAVPPEIVRLPRYTRADQDEIFGPGDDPYSVGDLGLTFRPKEIHLGIRAADDRLVAHIGLVPILLSVGDTELAAVGIGGLAVAPGRRDGSLARALLEAAFDHARTLGSAHALAFCRPRLVPYYERRGFHELAAEVTVEQPGGRLVVMPLRTIWSPLRDGAEWPAGAVRLRSLPI
ncbi:GNAT family N-acetyltransferase [Kitasatospora sp. NPDC056531]|uniref:GNAT family N-acetyltransferase n=1 Tax=Kitasatospora sp. NPDC056531 TaxID=3345856 RepID=UPI0036936D87